MVFLGKAEGFSTTELKDSVRGLRYKIDIFNQVLAFEEKYLDYIVSAAKHFNTGMGFFRFLSKSLLMNPYFYSLSLMYDFVIMS